MGNQLALAWSDGEENYYTFEALRRACPCANCQGEPDALGRVVRPNPTLGPKAFDLISWETVGGYALQFRWGDGHSTGLYSYQYLRNLGD
ncbi:gamma-butyrobetaine hydroxylase-like domain-containing protein [Roseibacillus persicicus]|nr:DUF971 domain-containing protein [Roseibacillus persicicus]